MQKDWELGHRRAIVQGQVDNLLVVIFFGQGFTRIMLFNFTPTSSFYSFVEWFDKVDSVQQRT